MSGEHPDDPCCVVGYPEFCPDCVRIIRNMVVAIADTDDQHDLNNPECDHTTCKSYHNVRRECMTFLMEEYGLDIQSINLAVATHRHHIEVSDPNVAPEVFHLPINPEGD